MDPYRLLLQFDSWAVSTVHIKSFFVVLAKDFCKRPSFQINSLRKLTFFSAPPQNKESSYFSIHPCMHPSTNLSISQSVLPLIHSSARHSVYPQSISPSVPPIHIYSTIYQSLHQSINLSIYPKNLSTNPSIQIIFQSIYLSITHQSISPSANQ